MAGSRKKRRGLDGGILRLWAAWWVGGMLLWLLLTTSFDLSEAAVGVAAAGIAATAVAVVSSRRPIGFRPRLRWSYRALRIPVRVALDTWSVTEALWLHATGRRAIRGRWSAVPFAHGGADDPVAAARRALIALEVTIVPNSFLVGVDAERDVLLIHQLVRDPAELARLAEDT